ncbi:MAG: HEPN domain-containing protein [Chitinophagales bacterium]|nr:HEPN domain-containing protein [Chitinophagales bacterium]
MDEVNTLLKKSAEAIDDALLLIEHHRNEAAANRSYYSLFYSIQALLLSVNEVPKTHKGMHIRFYELFIKSGIFAEEISQNAQALLNLRQEGEYDLEDLSDEIIQEAKAKTEKVLQVIHQHMNKA